MEKYKKVENSKKKAKTEYFLNLYESNKLEFIDKINNGYPMQPLIDHFKLGNFYRLYKFFDYVNDDVLYAKCKSNSNQYVKELGIIKCTAPNAPRLKSSTIPKEIENKYLELRDLGWHKEKIKRYFKETYKETRYYFKRLYAQYPLIKYNYAGKPLKSSKHRRAGGKIGYVIINNRKLLYRSSLELRCFLQLELMGLDFKTPNFKIPYIDEDGISRNYYPDVLIGDNLVEIKPYAYMSTGYNIPKYRAARQYCEENDLYFSVWNELHIRYKPTYEELVKMVKIGKLIPNTPIETYEKLVKNWNSEIRRVNALSDINMAFIWKDQFSPKFGISIPEKYQIIIDKYKGIKNEKRIKQ